MYNLPNYFKLARLEELEGHYPSALLLYLSSFCEKINRSAFCYPYQETEKIRRLQVILNLSDENLLRMVHSYGPLSDITCQKLLLYSFQGNLGKIKNVLANSHPHDRRNP